MFILWKTEFVQAFLSLSAGQPVDKGMESRVSSVEKSFAPVCIPWKKVFFLPLCLHNQEKNHGIGGLFIG